MTTFNYEINLQAMEQTTLQHMAKFPEYGLQMFIQQAKKEGFTLASMAENSVPTAGSNTRPIELVTKEEVHIYRVIKHREGNITLVTELGYLKLLK